MFINILKPLFFVQKIVEQEVAENRRIQRKNLHTCVPARKMIIVNFLIFSTADGTGWWLAKSWTIWGVDFHGGETPTDTAFFVICTSNSSTPLHQLTFIVWIINAGWHRHGHHFGIRNHNLFLWPALTRRCFLSLYYERATRRERHQCNYPATFNF